MTLIRNLPTLASLLAAMALGGCITLLPDAKPVQLYRFTPEMVGVLRQHRWKGGRLSFAQVGSFIPPHRGTGFSPQTGSRPPISLMRAGHSPPRSSSIRP